MHPGWECEDCGRCCLGYEPLDLNLMNYALRNLPRHRSGYFKLRQGPNVGKASKPKDPESKFSLVLPRA